MYTVQIARIRKLCQIAADGLQGDIKALRQILHHDTAFALRDIQNFALPETERHPSFLSLRKIKLCFRTAFAFDQARFTGKQERHMLQMHCRSAARFCAKCRIWLIFCKNFQKHTSDDAE